MIACNHSSNERLISADMLYADGICPLCLNDELESLRQENSRLREENHRLKVHLCIGTDALKEPADLYEVVRKDELNRLREALEKIYDAGTMYDGAGQA